MTAENSDGGAPCEIRYSAIGRLPMWEAAPRAVSQSPKPQSQAAFASDCRVPTSSLTRCRSKCATVTISRANSGGCAGKTSLIIIRSLPEFDVSVSSIRADNLQVLSGRTSEAILSRLRLDKQVDIGAASLAELPLSSGIQSHNAVSAA